MPGMDFWKSGGKSFKLSKAGVTSHFPVLMGRGHVSLPYAKKGISVDPSKEKYK